MELRIDHPWHIASLPKDAVKQCNDAIPKDAQGAPTYPINSEDNGYTNQFHIAKASEVDGLSMCERLQKRGSPHVGEATVFVSWNPGNASEDSGGRAARIPAAEAAATRHQVLGVRLCDPAGHAAAHSGGQRRQAAGSQRRTTTSSGWATACAPSGTRCCCWSRGTRPHRSSAPTASRRSTTRRRAARSSTW
eukprot:scaffold38380_cov58-Phaeocystis_antarctica.AAC.4